ncbi:uncharacterized protein LOC143821444 isoform X2 [Paroedura picta]|uniref:uncharacterized protein LOC143821444 isoform X2 n=1 Tax=Paroedura picta TaxID=143630 RepID=UPI0040578DB6
MQPQSAGLKLLPAFLMKRRISGGLGIRRRQKTGEVAPSTSGQQASQGSQKSSSHLRARAPATATRVSDGDSSSEASGNRGTESTSSINLIPQTGSSAYWQGYSQAVAQLTGAKARHGSSHRCSTSEEASGGSGTGMVDPARVQMGLRRKRGRRQRSGGHKRRRAAHSSPTSGESSSSEEGMGVRRKGWYWLEGAFVPGLPAWLHYRRGEATRLLDAEGIPVGDRVPPNRFKDTEAPPGVHLPTKLRERALEGYYVDVFSFVRGKGKAGNTGSKKDSKRQRTVPTHERTFDNWLKGFTEYFTLVSASYPERG